MRKEQQRPPKQQGCPQAAAAAQKRHRPRRTMRSPKTRSRQNGDWGSLSPSLSLTLAQQTMVKRRRRPSPQDASREKSTMARGPPTQKSMACKSINRRSSPIFDRKKATGQEPGQQNQRPPKQQVTIAQAAATLRIKCVTGSWRATRAAAAVKIRGRGRIGPCAETQQVEGQKPWTHAMTEEARPEPDRSPQRRRRGRDVDGTPRGAGETGKGKNSKKFSEPADQRGHKRESARCERETAVASAEAWARR